LVASDLFLIRISVQKLPDKVTSSEIEVEQEAYEKYKKNILESLDRL